MEITSILSGLIYEQSRFEILYDKMVKPFTKDKKGIIDFEVLKDFIRVDPTTKVPEGFNFEEATVEDMNNVKVGKYVQWLLKNFVTPKPTDFEFESERNPKQYTKALDEYRSLFLEDLYKQTERLQYYERAKQYLPQEQRDINRLGIRDLFNIFGNFKLPEKKVKDIEKKEAKKTREGFKHAGGEIVHQGPKWTVIKISDKGSIGKDAADYYGGFQNYQQGESDWCTSSPGVVTNFNRYIKDGPLYVIFPNDDKGEVGQKTGLPKERYQFHFPSSQFMNRDDRQIDLVGMLNGEMSEIKDLFKEEFMKSLLNKSNEILHVEYPQSSEGKFLFLYGFDEFFKTLPDNITHLTLTNNSNIEVDLDIPNTIERFKDLQILSFKNIVKSLPDIIGNLTNLKLLTLIGNKKLKTIPKTIVNLENLDYIVLKNNSSDFKIPEELKDVLVETAKDVFIYIKKTD
jgi:hypothetical protein